MEVAVGPHVSHLPMMSPKFTNFINRPYLTYLGSLLTGPCLPPPKRTYLGKVEVRDSNGHIVDHVETFKREERYLELERRQDELIDQALRLEPNNPLARYFKATRPFRESLKDQHSAVAVAKLYPQSRGRIWRLSFSTDSMHLERREMLVFRMTLLSG